MEKHLQGVPYKPEKSQNPAPGPVDGGVFDIKISGDGKHLFVDVQPAKYPCEDLPACWAHITIYHKYISKYGFCPERLQGMTFQDDVTDPNSSKFILMDEALERTNNQGAVMKRKKYRFVSIIPAFILIFLLSWENNAALVIGLVPAQDERISRQEAMEKTLDIAGMKPGMIIGEVGAGTGHFTTFLLERLGVSGKVYANDIDSDSLEVLRKRSIENVEIVLGGTDDPDFPVNNLDLIIMRSVFHDLENPLSMMENIKKYLRPDAPMVIVEFHAKDPIDPASLPMHVLTKNEFLAIVHQSGFEMKIPVDIPGWWSVYVFKVNKNREKTVWPDWLSRFRTDVKKVQEFEKNENVSSCKKRIAWERLFNSYRENSPETTEDEQLREYVEERITSLGENTDRYESIDQDDIEAILERLGFGVRVRIRVKSGDFPNLFKKISPEGDPVVVDEKSGLMWHQSGSKEAIDFFSAQAWIDDLNIRNYAGYSDWRLPTAEDAASIIEAEKGNGGLHVDPVFSEVQYVLWTGNNYYPGRSWLVEFIRAGFVDDLKIHVGWVRPVRKAKTSPILCEG